MQQFSTVAKPMYSSSVGYTVSHLPQCNAYYGIFHDAVGGCMNTSNEITLNSVLLMTEAMNVDLV